MEHLIEHALSQGGVGFRRRRTPAEDRYYLLLIQPTLFGGWDLVCQWGRRSPGPRPHRLTQHYGDRRALRLGLAEAIGRRLHRGYATPAPSPTPRRAAA